MESQTPVLKAGHHWKEADRVADYVSQEDRDAAEMAKVFRIMTDMLPFEPDAPLRVLDVGSGHGVVAAAVLDAFPNATAVGLDVSEAMMEVGRPRMARFGDRFRYHPGDFSDGTLPAELVGPFDVVVSARAIHHLVSENKQRLYADIRGHLADDGCFVNIDNMRAKDDFFRPLYRRGPAAVRPAPRPAADPSQPRSPGSGEHPDPMEDQLGWFREAGYSHVDCFWKQLGRSMIVGFK